MIALFAAVRAIHFASLMAIFGASAYLALLRSQLHIEMAAPAVRILFVSAATLAFFTAGVWLCLVAGQMSGDWHKALDPATLEAVATGTRFGEVFLGRLAGLTLVPSENYIREYWWCKPPRISRETTVPRRSMAL